MSARQAYNVVTDLGGGPNVRLKDNLYQGLAILVCMLIGAGVGMIIADEMMLGLIAGGFIGVLVGLFGSGIFIMVYRGLSHARGKHD